jgi:hypothetical protein
VVELSGKIGLKTIALVVPFIEVEEAVAMKSI